MSDTPDFNDINDMMKAWADSGPKEFLAPNPADFVTSVYLTDGEVYDHEGRLATCAEGMLIVGTGDLDGVTVYNLRSVKYYEMNKMESDD